ncbi:hypothetical protein GCM10025870_28700 [Agromyces marinus]|uniref:Uncharacterized protein n=1 Tax=Agromyces marinus TaxID=1389020 RepID=A0ABM8H4R2_9MICO|nr:hypothetical protein GCM10025870_28700 [Agromyces marinus]
MPSTALSRAFRRAYRRARSEMSLAITRSLKRAACIAWMPHPVPRSKLVPTGRCSMSPLSVVDAPPTPSTYRSGSGPPVASSPGSDAIHQFPVPRRSVKA